MAPQKIKWGILSTAKIGRQKVIPGIQASSICEVVAIGSRDLSRAKSAAELLGIPRAYGSYEELFEDPAIDAIYNPLPNHLHVPWTIRAMQAGKHVLCEKPIGLTSREAQRLMDISTKYPGLKVMEAFMYRFHPQWIKAKGLIDDGVIGRPKVVQSFFSYFNADPDNIRNRSDIGGGGLMDIGCYCISFPRFIFGEEPNRVVGLIQYDPALGTDRIASGMLGFSKDRSSHFTCSTQLMPHQRCLIVGTAGHLEIEIPVNAPPDRETRMTVVTTTGREQFDMGPADQYTLQAEAFCQSILDQTPVPTPLEDAINNMKVIDALVESNRKKQWIML